MSYHWFGFKKLEIRSINVTFLKPTVEIAYVFNAIFLLLLTDSIENSAFSNQRKAINFRGRRCYAVGVFDPPPPAFRPGGVAC